MSEISIGAVGAAVIAGLVSLLGLIIGKEQKISEFRQAWIDDLRKSLVSYLVSINAISDAIRLKAAGKAIDDVAVLSNYKVLNEASHSIKLRINPGEIPAQKLLESMNRFEELSADNRCLTPANISKLEEAFLGASKELLKFEWKRVKRGENTFVYTKAVVILMIVFMVSILIYAWMSGGDSLGDGREGFHLIENTYL